jgi:hypothetical protein
MKNESQPEIKTKLFASLIHSRFTKQHPHSDFNKRVELGTWNFKLASQVICHYTGLASVRNTALLCWHDLEAIE